MRRLASFEYASLNYGGAGFIGRHIAEHFQNRAEVRVLDNLRSGFKGNLSGLECQLIVGSVLDRDLVREAMKGVDFVFHLAAMVSVPLSVQKPNECAAINAGGTTIVLEDQYPRSEYAAVVPAFIEKAIKNEPIAIFGDGQQMRDFIYVKDVVAANAFFALRSQVTGVFNVALGKQTTINDLAVTVRKLARSSSTIEYGAKRLGDVKHSVANVDKIHTAGFRPLCDFAGGLRATIEFFGKHSAGIEQGRHL